MRFSDPTAAAVSTTRINIFKIVTNCNQQGLVKSYEADTPHRISKASIG